MTAAVTIVLAMSFGLIVPKAAIDWLGDGTRPSKAVSGANERLRQTLQLAVGFFGDKRRPSGLSIADVPW